MNKKIPKNIFKFINKKETNSTYSTGSNSDRMKKRKNIIRKGVSIDKSIEKNIIYNEKLNFEKKQVKKNTKPKIISNFGLINNPIHNLQKKFPNTKIKNRSIEINRKKNNSLDFSFGNNSFSNFSEIEEKKEKLKKKNLFGKTFHSFFSSRNLNNKILTNSSSQSKAMNVNLMKLQNDSSYIQILNFVHNLTNNLIKEKYLNFLSMPRMLTLINNNENKRFIFIMTRSNAYNKLNIENYDIKFMEPNNREIIEIINILSVEFCQKINKKIDNINLIEFSIKTNNNDESNKYYYILSSSIEECNEMIKSINFILDLCKCAAFKIKEKFVNKKKNLNLIK